MKAKKIILITASAMAILIIALLIFSITNKHLNLISLQNAKNTKHETEKITKIAILCYHDISENKDIGYTVSPEEFDSQMKALYKKGYHAIALKDLLFFLYYKETLPEKPFVLTFDDGYFGMRTEVAPILRKYNFKATFFLPVDYIKEEESRRMKNSWDSPEQQNPPKYHLIWSEVKELFDDGYEIAPHGSTHIELNSKVISDKTLYHEVYESRQEIEARLNTEVYSFSYPSGQYIQKTIDYLKKLNYLGAVTTLNSESVNLSDYDPYKLPRYTIYDKTTIDEIFSYLSSK
jgi:peptidoglycan/xylan/chitin deacetylase (PgdA/CDA1 family)